MCRAERVLPGAAGTRQPAAEAGIALIVSLLFVIIVTGIVMSGTMAMSAHKKKMQTDYSRHALATQLARSGLTEGLGWFRKQTAQPVLAFEPVRDAAVDPPILDTDDPEVGIVREWPIYGLVWGRYEVWKSWDADPDAERRAWRGKACVADTSRARQVAPGAAWQLRSVGYVYAKRDASAAFDQAPNHVVAVQLLETDIRRLNIAPPGQAAINVGRGANLTVNTNGRVFGGGVGAGVYYPQGTGTPHSGPAADQRITGTPNLAAAPSYDDSVEAVFGVTRAELFAMANSIVTDMSSFPVPIPQYSIIVVDAPAVAFDSSVPLTTVGAAIVYIEGNATIAHGSLSNFTGLLYVDGNLTVRAPSDLKGSIVVTGNMTVQGMPDFADVYYDDEALNELRQNIGSYRISGALRRPDIR